MKYPCSKSLLIAGALLLSASAFAQDNGMTKAPPGKSMAMEHRDMAPMTQAEHDAFVQQRFEKIDANHDGYVTAMEMDQSRMAMKKDGAKMNNERTSADVIKGMDGNSDGKLSAAEYLAGMKRIFNNIDADKDGSLSVAEQQAARKSMATAMQHK